MRAVFLAAGAGGMYCGSCMRDNRVAATLVKQGRDVILVPLYTPLRTDETDVSQQRVLYGGLNVFLQQSLAIFRHTPAAIDSLFDTRWLLNWVGKFSSSTRPEDLGPLTLSVLQGEDGRQKKELDKLIEFLRGLKPDIVSLPNLMFCGQARRIREALDVPVVCTLSGEDIFLDRLPDKHRQQVHDVIAERAAHVDAFVSVTDYFARHASEHYRLPADRVHVIDMGIHVDSFRPAAPPADAPFTIGYLARICPEKGLRVLCDAFIRLRSAGRPCRLRIAGYLGKADVDYYNECVATLKRARLLDDVDLLGELSWDAKHAFLQSLHVLSVPTVFPEAKGFYVLEAMASGVPVVLPRRGSFPELVKKCGGGLLYDDQRPEALAETLASLIDDRDHHAQLATAGRQGVAQHYNADRMANETWQLFKKMQ